MFRTFFSIGAFALIGIMLIGIIFSLFGLAFGLALAALFFAIKAVILGAIIYLLVRIISPSTAARWRERCSGYWRGGSSW